MSDNIGRAIMVLAALGALGAFWSGVQGVGAAGPDRIWIEGWRMFGFLVFSGLFGLLAWRPRNLPGIWELAIGHKLAMVGFGIAVGPVAEANLAGRVDLILVLLIGLAWWLCRGWKSWGTAS
jgi:hypothetical protein